MAFWEVVPIVGDVIKGVIGLIDKSTLDKDVAEKLKADIQQQILNLDYASYDKVIEQKAKVLLGEIQGQSWLQRNWRPILMLTIVGIVANNYLVYPYLSLFGIKATPLDLPSRLWDLMTLGVGGYVAGRTAEKVVETWKKDSS